MRASASRKGREEFGLVSWVLASISASWRSVINLVPVFVEALGKDARLVAIEITIVCPGDHVATVGKEGGVRQQLVAGSIGAHPELGPNRLALSVENVPVDAGLAASVSHHNSM
jgi:hypothetical protein